MIDVLNSAASRWASYAWPAAWDGLVVGLLVLGALPLVRRLPARWSMWLATIALVKFFVPPVWQAPVAWVDEAAFQLRPELSLGALERGVVIALFLVYLVGLLLSAARLMRRRRHLLEWRRTARRVEDPWLMAQLTDLAAMFHLRRVPALLVSDAVDAPIAVGVREPAIILPLGLAERVTREHLRIVLAHEIVHHRHRDLAGECAIAVASVCWWFHPVALALVREIRAFREERCDADVVAIGVIDAPGYCRALLDVAAASLASPAIAMREASHPLGRRFRRLLRGDARASGAIAVLLLVALAVLALPNSTWSRQRQRDAGRASDDRRVIRIIDVR